MSITDIRPKDCSPDLRAKIEKVMQKNGLTWKDALNFLARKVVAPTRTKKKAKARPCTP